MRPLRIALVLQELPLPFESAVGRWYSVLLRGLVARGHDVTAFAASGRPAAIPEAEALFPAPRYRLRCYPHAPAAGLRSTWAALRRPRSYPFDAAFRRDLEAEIARGVDVLHLEDLWSGWLALPHARLAFLSLHNLLEADLAGVTADTLRGRLRDLRARRAERFLVRRFPVIRTLTPPLSARVRALNPRAHVHTIPLGLDLAGYPFEAERGADDRPTVALIGSFDWHPTRSAATRLLTRLWPAIKRRVPEARLQLVGRSARSALRGAAPPPDVSVHEDVPDTIPYFRRTDVLLYAPAQGSGMKVKVLEAFALGVPVVTTADGVEGLPAEDGVHAGICGDDAGLVDRCVALLHDRAAARRMRIAARALLAEVCDPDAAVAAVERGYDAMLAARVP